MARLKVSGEMMVRESEKKVKEKKKLEQCAELAHTGKDILISDGIILPEDYPGIIPVF